AGCVGEGGGGDRPPEGEPASRAVVFARGHPEGGGHGAVLPAVCGPLRLSRRGPMGPPARRWGPNAGGKDAGRDTGLPARSASRPARGTAVPPVLASYRGPWAISGCAGLEEGCWQTNGMTTDIPAPASWQPTRSRPVPLSPATRKPRSTTVSRNSSVMGTSDGQ